MRAIALVLVAGLLTGCAGPLADGESQFDRGRYPEAKQTFASLESESRRWSDDRRAAYALYRGLTLGALGDRAMAGVWLREAKAIEDTHPGSLSPEDARRLHLGLESHEGD
jgi:TolA-binding protein